MLDGALSKRIPVIEKRLSNPFDNLVSQAIGWIEGRLIQSKASTKGDPQSKSNTHWDFCGFIGEKPFPIESVTSAKEIREQANICTGATGTYFSDLKRSILYSGIFFVLFENSNGFMIDSMVKAPIQLLPTPTLNDILKLKEQLAQLIATSKISNPEVNDGDRFNNELDEIVSRYKKYEEGVTRQDMNEEQRENALEEMRYNCSQEIIELVQKYKK